MLIEIDDNTGMTVDGAWKLVNVKINCRQEDAWDDPNHPETAEGDWSAMLSAANRPPASLAHRVDMEVMAQAVHEQDGLEALTDWELLSLEVRSLYLSAARGIAQSIGLKVEE